MSISYFRPVISNLKNSSEKYNKIFWSNFSSLLLLVNKSPYSIIQHNYDTGGCCARFVELFSEFREGEENASNKQNVQSYYVLNIE